MTRRTVTAFLSVQSPYSHFAVPRLEWLSAQPEVTVAFRLVAPGVLRRPDLYAGRGAMEQAYFARDVARTAGFLGMTVAEAEPSPVEFEPGSLWLAAPDQPRIRPLLELVLAAEMAGDGLAAFAAVMALIWGGQGDGWHTGDRLDRALATAGLDPAALRIRIASDRDALRARLDANGAALLAAGHWGVPCFETGGEPFYGQDRLDQLFWRLGLLERFRASGIRG